MKIELKVSNLGHVPSFKNNKRAIRLPNGAMRTLTEKSTKKWMDAAIHNFGFQLLSYAQTVGTETLTEQQRRSLIASSLPLDDSRHWIKQLVISDRDVESGWEGAIITIEEI